MVGYGEIDRSLEVNDVLRDEVVVDALKQLKSRNLISSRRIIPGSGTLR